MIIEEGCIYLSGMLIPTLASVKINKTNEFKAIKIQDILSTREIEKRIHFKQDRYYFVEKNGFPTMTFSTIDSVKLITRVPDEVFYKYDTNYRYITDLFKIVYLSSNEAKFYGYETVKDGLTSMFVPNSDNRFCSKISSEKTDSIIVKSKDLKKIFDKYSKLRDTIKL